MLDAAMTLPLQLNITGAARVSAAVIQNRFPHEEMLNVWMGEPRREDVLPALCRRREADEGAFK
jgi:hypothetical protein